MKSAYGGTTPPPTRELTYVEAGSPMGELFRRYWQPVCLSEELTDLPRKIMILCEELVLFRTKNGQSDVLSRTAAIGARPWNLGAWSKTDCAVVTTNGYLRRTAKSWKCHAKIRESASA
jgi:hypothetical protein